MDIVPKGLTHSFGGRSGGHSYEVPEIIALPVIGGNEDYLKWLNREVKA